MGTPRTGLSLLQQSVRLKQVKTGENTGITAGNKLVAAGNRGESFQ